ncbi:MAG: High-affnity carbon uptake protein Hat/HatR [Raineya sp.]|jgi:energy-coupling factor transporter ATP-binding protein EcfA2|nr:High-affnity carbon uptake protein Hat/HatR [Raineya sp.]
METNVIQNTILQQQQGVSFNPFPGLRPFTIEESHLFFGREGQSDEVLMKLYQNRFVAVVGPSGSGKSSFIYCGVIPILYGGFVANKTSNWNVVVSRPGASPIDNLAESIYKKIPQNNASEEDQKIRKKVIATLLRSSSLGLIESIMQTKEFSDKNTLILIDQFEELFRFRRQDDPEAINEALNFVNLLTEAIRYEGLPIYVAITMRSDFIGECAFFPELTRAINNSYYMIPQMTREQKRNAITGPVAVGGGEITPRLVQRLLNDLGDNPDQLPILQHSLMRTWDYWMRHKETDEPVDVHHYEAIGTMSEALSLHANEAYDELTEGQKRVCEKLFKSITEKGGDQNQGIRRPTRLSEITAIAGAREEDVIAIIDKFREPGRSLLTPAMGVTLTGDSIIDISHESLMRIWVRLKNWVDDEAEAVQMYQRLSEASAMYQIGKAGLWRPPDLQLALNWREKHKPSLIWAKRHNPAFERAMVFLDYSQKEYETEQRIKEMLQKRTLKRTRITAIIMGLFTLVAIAFLIYALAKRVEADQQRAKALVQTKIAEKQKIVAQEKEREALKAKEEAEKAKEEAVLAQKEAEKQKEEAEKQKEEAEKQKDIAEKQRAEAVKAKEEARRSEASAKESARVAQEATKEATKQAELARAAENKAKNQRLLSIAQSMALKSKQLSDDPELQALNAQQAYKFHSENGGSKFHPDIYQGLYYAIRTYEGQDFNKLKGHTDYIRGIVPANSGKYMYSAGSDGQVLRFDLEDTKKPGDVLIKNPTYNTTMAMNHNGQSLAVGSHTNKIQIFNIQGDSKSLKNTIVLPEGITTWYLAYPSRSDNGLAFVASNNKVYFYNNKEAKALGVSTEQITALAITSDGKNVITGNEKGEVVFWNTTTGEQKIFTKDNNAVSAIRVSHNGKWMSIGNHGGKLKLYDMNKGTDKPINLFGHNREITDIAFSNDDNQMASASRDKTVRVWNLNALNTEPMVFNDYSSWVTALNFSADGLKLIAGTKDKTIRFWYTDITKMSDYLCGKIRNNMSLEEWERYVATPSDVPFENTCGNLPQRQ